MKKAVISFLFYIFLTTTVFGQGINITFIPEGVQSATENTELLLSDPLIDQVLFYVPNSFQQKKDEVSRKGEGPGGGLRGVTIGMETEVSSRSKAVTLPLMYRWRHFNFGLNLPYIYQRKMNYISSDRKAAGMGDISLNLNYSRVFMNLLWNAGVFVKLPTGDSDKTVDGYLVPLGTGSTDVILNLAVMKAFPNYTLSGSAVLSFNGSDQKIAEIQSDQGLETIDYTITNGNMFSLTGRLDYPLNSRWTAGGLVVFTTVGEGSSDQKHSFDWGAPGYTETGISNKQDMTLVDIIPNASFDLMGLDLTLFLKVPLVTVRNEDNNEGSRGLTFLFKFSREL